VSAYRRFWRSLVPGVVLAGGLLVLVAVLLAQLAGISGSGDGLFSSLGPRDWKLLQFSVFQAALSTVLSLAVGLTVAWALSHQRNFTGRNLLIALLSSALVLPTLVVVLGLVTVLGRSGWVNGLVDAVSGASFGGFIYGLAGILIAHVYLNASFAARGLLIRLESIPAEKRKLARSLGLTPVKRFMLVEWPAIRSTLPGLGVTIFLLCFTSFAIVLTLGGSPKFNTLEVAIYEAIKLDFDIARALDIALLQLVICGALVFLASGFRSATAMISAPVFRSGWPEPSRQKFLQLAIIAVFGLFFILPLVAVVFDGLDADFSRLIAEATFRSAFVTSIVLASGSSLLTLAVALAIGLARRDFSLRHRAGAAAASGFIDRVLSFSTTLYLAFPSLALGLGFFLLARTLPLPLNFWAGVALLVANTLMALPFAVAVLGPALQKTAQRYDRTAISLGLSGLARWRYVEWPLLRKDIGYVLSIGFCLSLGDLGVIALFGNQDFATLPWYLYQKMGSYRTDDAAGIALILLGLTLTVFLALPWLLSDQKREDGHAAA